MKNKQRLVSIVRVCFFFDDDLFEKKTILILVLLDQLLGPTDA